MEFSASVVGAVRVIDDAGGEAPSQVLSWQEAGRDRPALYNAQRASAELVFLARDVPGAGYRTYYLEALPAPAGLAGATAVMPVADDVTLEAGPYRLAIRGGRLASLVETGTGRELLGAGVNGPPGTGPHRYGEVVVLEDLLVDLEDGPLEQVRNVPGGPAEARPGPPRRTSPAGPGRAASSRRGWCGSSGARSRRASSWPAACRLPHRAGGRAVRAPAAGRADAHAGLAGAEECPGAGG